MRTAVVVGAGIGGVTAALALHQQGWRVTVLERAKEWGEVGAGLSLWPSAVTVLHHLGVEGVEPGPRPPGPWGMRLADGRWIVRSDHANAPTPEMIHRAQLHHRITDQLGSGVTVRTGFTVTGVEQDSTGATVHGAAEQVRADLVVAADGIRSTVRRVMHPRYRGARYAGYTSYRGLADLDTDDGGGETWGRGTRFGFARLVDGRIYWYATANQPAGRTGDLDEVRALFGDWHDPIPAILAATTTLLQTDLHDLALPLVSFVTGRVVLLGDAAHAMTPNLGRGACSAIEDAGALARHLGDHNTLDAALAAYDHERRPATTRLVALSRRVGALGQVEHPATGTIRDSLLVAAGKLTAWRRPSIPT
jgi:2-polyprenyl-6-methoxyphenol hydroxylase-like FAD-dependent oxidoreductase